MNEGGCRTVKVKGHQQGHTKVIATYDHGGITLQSAVTIATYDKLIVSLDVIVSVLNADLYFQSTIVWKGKYAYIKDTSDYTILNF